MREAVPKLEVAVKRLRSLRGSEPPTPVMTTTFIDGKVVVMDLSVLTKAQVYATLDLQTGRLELEAMQRGKPWVSG